MAPTCVSTQPKRRVAARCNPGKQTGLGKCSRRPAGRLQDYCPQASTSTVAKLRAAGLRVRASKDDQVTEDQGKEEVKDEPGFYWDPANMRWVRDDKRGLPVSKMNTLIQPKSGAAYTAWPVVHTILAEHGLKSYSVEEAMDIVGKGKAVIVDIRPTYDFEAEHIEGSINVPLFQPVQGDSMMDQVKRFAVGFMAMKATERNPNFAEDAKKILGDEKRQLIVACTIGGTLETEVQRKDPKREAFKDPVSPISTDTKLGCIAIFS